MGSVFAKIHYIHCAKPLDGAMQMAIDELLLAEARGVIFRDYQWSSPTTSIGYFGISSEILSISPGTLLVRRPTGGGLVEHRHGRDFTYSVVISATEARRSRLSPRESYRKIHGALATVLQKTGIAVILAGDTELSSGGSVCFANPVGDDVIMNGKKIAGAGQKRSRGAILHQGSVQAVDLPDDFGAKFAATLGEEVEELAIDEHLLERAEVLAESKYRRPEWTHRR